MSIQIQISSNPTFISPLPFLLTLLHAQETGSDPEEALSLAPVKSKFYTMYGWVFYVKPAEEPHEFIV